MLDSALLFLRNEINGYLHLRYGQDSKLKLTNLVNQKGEIQFSDLALTLVHVEEERTIKSQEYITENQAGVLTRRNPPIYLNLHVMVAANFGVNYDEALKYLGYVVSFFQGKSVFTHQNSPSLPADINKLVVELISLPPEQTNHIWGSLGAKYMPSVVYKLRMMVVEDLAGKGEAPRIQELETNMESK